MAIFAYFHSIYHKANVLGRELLLVATTIFFPAWAGLWDSPIFFLISFIVYFFISLIFNRIYFLVLSSKIYLTIFGFIKTIIVLFLFSMAFLFQGKLLFGYQIFHIPTESMMPTLLVGDYVFVNTHDHSYEKSDIVVFVHREHDRDNYFVKRITHVKGDLFHEKILNDMHYAVMGDNRDESLDSRIFGAISKKDIVGKVVWVAASYDQHWKVDRFFMRLNQ